MFIRYEKKTIELTKVEMHNASQYGSPAYNDLMNARRDNPNFRVVEIKAKKTAKTPLDRLNLTTIRAYVKANGSPEQKKDFLTISTPTITEDGMYRPAWSFFEIKKWFLLEFPQYTAALDSRYAEIISINDAIEAKIAAAARKAAEEARAKAAEEAKSFLSA